MNQVSEGQVQINNDQVTEANTKDVVFNKWANEPVATTITTTITKETIDASKERLFSQWGSLPIASVIGNHDEVGGYQSSFYIRTVF